MKDLSSSEMRENRGYFQPADINKIPETPGVYLMKNQQGTIIYVGKAKNLKKRVSSYFQKKDADRTLKTQLLVENITLIDTISVLNETEALLLEANLIKEYKPRYNVVFKDNKFYPFVKVTVQEAFPRIVFTREQKKDGARYFGPYVSARSVRQYIDVVQRIFKIRTCVEMPKKECLNFHINRCSGPCIMKIVQDEYRKQVNEAMEFLSGNYGELIGNLEKSMQEASRALLFEKAQILKEKIAAVKVFEQSQSVFLESKISADFIGIFTKMSRVVIVVTMIRSGRMIGKRSYSGVLQLEEEMEDVLARFLVEYADHSDKKQDLIIIDEDYRSIIKELNRVYRDKGYAFQAAVPADDKQKALVRMAEENAALHLAQVISKVDTSESLKMLQKILELDTLPMRIEGFDIANILGQNAVASLVSFYAGNPDKKNYRRFKIKSKTTADDFAMIHEAVYRRYKRLKEEESDLPDLVLIDGGRGQLNAALEAISEAGVSLNLISLAKQNEEIYTPYLDDPIVLPKNSPALHVLQRVRDETHRFANDFYNRLKSKSMLDSLFKDIPEIGKKRTKIILQKFLSYDIIKKVRAEDLMKEGIPKETADLVIQKLQNLE